MAEWIVLADSPTRAMERFKTGEVVRCRDCKFYYGGECTLLDFSLRDMEDGYCAWSEPREEG